MITAAIRRGPPQKKGQEKPFVFGTKAETLERLRPFVRRSEVLDLVHFRVEDWAADRPAILAALDERFAGAADAGHRR